MFKKWLWVLSALNAPWSQNITRQFEQIPDLVWELKRDWGLTYSIFSLSSRRGGRTGFYGGAAELIQILTRLYRNAGWKKGSHTQSTTGQGYTGRRAAWLPAIWKVDKSNNKSIRGEKKGGNKKEGDKRRPGRTQKLPKFCFSTRTGWDTFKELCIHKQHSARVCSRVPLMCWLFAELRVWPMWENSKKILIAPQFWRADSFHL